MTISRIERVAALSRQSFRRDYLSPPRPVIMTAAVENWDGIRRLSPEQLLTAYHDCLIRVEVLEHGSGMDAAHWMSHVRLKHMTIEEYFRRTRSETNGGSLYAAQIPLRGSLSKLNKEIGKPPFNHFSNRLRRVTRQHPNLWVGPGGCVSSLHFDLVHNFNVQICGRKRFVLYDPRDMPYLYLPSDLELSWHSRVDIESPDLEKFPKFVKATPLECMLEPGETLFIPKGWPHATRSLEYCVNLNYWWPTMRDVVVHGPKQVLDRVLLRIRKLKRRMARASSGGGRD